MTTTDYTKLNINTLYNIDGVKIESRKCLYGDTTDCSRDDSTSLKSIREIMENYDNKVVPSENAAKITLAKSEISAVRDSLIKKLTKYSDNSDSYTKLQSNINTLRADLDTKLDNLNKGKGSIYDEYQSHYESTMMAGLMWGTLAGTVIYYVFYK